jgi:hypothetical protein
MKAKLDDPQIHYWYLADAVLGRMTDKRREQFVRAAVHNMKLAALMPSDNPGVDEVMTEVLREREAECEREYGDLIDQVLKGKPPWWIEAHRTEREEAEG